MNLILNLKDINRILAKTHFKCKFKKIAETCLYEAVGILPVIPSLLPHVLCGRSKVSLFFTSVVRTGVYIYTVKPV